MSITVTSGCTYLQVGSRVCHKVSSCQWVTDLDSKSYDRSNTETERAEPPSPYKPVREGQLAVLNEYADVASQ